MAEQPVVWNKKLLVVALILGVLAVALFYVYDAIREREATGSTVPVLHWKRDIEAGKAVTAADITVKDIPRSRMSAFENTLSDNPEDWNLAKDVLRQPVKRGEPVRYADLLSVGGSGDPKIKAGMVGFPLSKI